MNARSNQKYGPWIALFCCVVLLVTAIALTNVSAPAWKFQLVPVIAICFVCIVMAITQMQRENRDLRRQIARLEEKAAAAAEPPQDVAAKGAYSIDDDGQRRLHISRLEVFFLVLVPGALTLI